MTSGFGRRTRPAVGAWRLLATVTLVLGLADPVGGAPAEATVFAAASTTNAVEEIAAAFEGRGTGRVRCVFAASSTLARQVAQGAPADLFLSADADWMDYLEERGLVAPGARTDLVGNRLVVVVPTGSNLAVSLESGAGFAAAVGDGRVAMGDPAHVPAGRYAKAALQSLGAWSALKPKTALAGNVRAALALVERGEAVAGLVYATDAAISDKVRVAAVFPPRSQGRIAYPLALLAGERNRAATGLYQFFRGPEARAIFRKHGFTPLEAHD